MWQYVLTDIWQLTETSGIPDWVFCRRVRKIANSEYQLRHVCLSVRMEQLIPNWSDFHKIWCVRIFRISVEKSQVSWKSVKNNGYFTWTPIYIYGHTSLSSPLSEKCFKQTAKRKSKHTFYVQYFFSPRQSCRLWDNVEKYCTAGQTTDDNMAHAHCMLDPGGYKHKLGIRNIYCFCTATMAVRKLL